MKKLMLVMGLLSMVVFTHAAESKQGNPVSGIEKQASIVASVIEVQDVFQLSEFEFSITLKATFGPSFARVEVSCTATGATAEEAYDNAALCLAVAGRRIAKAIM